MKRASKKKSRPTYEADLVEALKDPEEVIGYLRAALDERDMPEVFLVALRNVAKSRGMTRLAREAGLSRENLYRLLSREGNPRLGSLHAILEALGLRLSVEKRRPLKKSVLGTGHAN